MMITYVLPELVIALQLYHPQGFRQRYPILLPPFPSVRSLQDDNRRSIKNSKDI